MLLQEVETLVFTTGEVTNARRSSPLPQMACKGGPCQYAPTTAMCRNVGWDGNDVTWKCEAELPKGVRFGKVEVNCEGFPRADSEYVLRGSCGLEYALQGAPLHEVEEREEDTWWNRARGRAGERIHHGAAAAADASSSWWQSWFGDSRHSHLAHAKEYARDAKDYAHRQYDHASDSIHHAQHQSAGLWSLLSWLVSTALSLMVKAVAAVVVLYLVWRVMRPAAVSAPPPRPQPRSSGLFRSLLGGLPFVSGLSSLLNADASQDPPPQYPGHDASGGYNPSTYDKRYQSSYGRAQQAQQPQQQQQQQQGSNWSVLHGLLGGSLLGYLMGRRRAAPAAAAAAPVYTQPAPSSSSWFGGAAPARPEPTTVHHVHHNAPPMNPEYSRRTTDRYPTASSVSASSYDPSPDPIPDVRTTETTTAYARTKRR